MGRLLSYLSFFLTLIAVLFFAVQQWRDPAVHSDYIPAFYKNQTQSWDGNGYLAVQGLNAPADMEDFYNYGQQKVYDAFARQQRFKKELGVAIPPTYPLPDLKIDAALIARPDEDQLKLEPGDGGTSIPCRYSWPDEETMKETCLKPERLKENIARNAILWKRFNTLPDYKTFSTIPIGIEGFLAGQDLITLSRWKSAEILEIAYKGNPEAAFQEWRRYMQFYRTMLMTHDTAVWKAIVMILEGQHYQIYNKLLYHHPVLGQFVHDLEAQFPPSGIGRYQAQNLWSDEWAQIEEAMLATYHEQAKEKGAVAKLMTPTGDFRNRVYECHMRNAGYLKDKRIFDFAPDAYAQLCTSLFPNIYEGFVKIIFTMTGNPLSNITSMLLVGGSLRGGELISNMYKMEMKWRMALLGSHIIADKIPADRIEAYLARNVALAENTPLLWDRDKNRLFFKDINGDEHSFYLPGL